MKQKGFVLAVVILSCLGWALVSGSMVAGGVYDMVVTYTAFGELFWKAMALLANLCAVFFICCLILMAAIGLYK